MWNGVEYGCDWICSLSPGADAKNPDDPLHDGAKAFLLRNFADMCERVNEFLSKPRLHYTFEELTRADFKQST